MRPLRDARHVQQVIHQPRQLSGLPFDHVDRGVRVRKIGQLTRQHLRGVADGRQRVAQLVREQRQELVLLAVRLAQRLLTGSQLLLHATALNEVTCLAQKQVLPTQFRGRPGGASA